MDRYRSDVDSVSPIPVDLEHQLRSPLAPQKAFRYPIVRWSKWLNDLDGIDEVLATLPAALDRSIAAERIDVLLDDDKTAAAFVVAMIWGHGSSGYGPFRTARILTGTADPAGEPLSPNVLEELKRSVDIAHDGGAVSGYRYLNNDGKITGLGPAFFTKWLYFVTARGNPTSPSAAPVLDALVIEWLRRHAHVRIRSGRTADYSAYIDHLAAWGTATDHTPVEVEERIFRLIRNDGTPHDSTTENDERTNHDQPHTPARMAPRPERTRTDQILGRE